MYYGGNIVCMLCLFSVFVCGFVCVCVCVCVCCMFCGYNSCINYGIIVEHILTGYSLADRVPQRGKSQQSVDRWYMVQKE